MRKIEISDATASLAEYAREANKETVIVTVKGKPTAALVAIKNADWETISLSTNPDFIELIERSRARRQAEGGISSGEMRRRLGLKERTRRK